MPSTRESSSIVSNGAFAGPYLRFAARYSGASAPLGRRRSSGSRQSAIASTSPPPSKHRRRRPRSADANESIRGRIDIDTRRLVDRGDLDCRVAVVPAMRLAVGVHAAAMRGRISSNAPRSTAPSASARARASDTAFRVASASLRMLKANPLARTVSSRPAIARGRSRCPTARHGPSRGAVCASSYGGTALARNAPRPAAGLGRLARRDVERRPWRTRLRGDVDADQQRQPLRIVPLISP